jgi:serine/threonine protein kinase
MVPPNQALHRTLDSAGELARSAAEIISTRRQEMVRTRIGATLKGPDDREFVLTEFLGSGAFGEVYRADERNTNTGAIAAAKLLPLHGIDDEDLVLALMNEARLATEVSHPNVVGVLFVGEDSEIGPYVLMEYVAGQTLQEFLHNKASSGDLLPLQAVLDMMLHVAQGACAINKVLVHRDIKPDNILLAGSRLKITDFGLSKLVAERTRTHTFKGVGPIKYMAPEAWQFQQNTHKIDVYSVGIVFFEMLTLKHPLQNAVSDPTHVESWRKAHLFSPAPDIRTLRDDVPRPLAQLLSRMVAKRPADRPDWEEVIQIVSSTGADNPGSEGLSSIVERAVARQASAEKNRLAEAEKQAHIREMQELYLVSFEQMVGRWEEVVDAFNAEFQGGMIRKRTKSRTKLAYDLPNATSIIFSLFTRRETHTKINGGTVIGGCLVAIEHGPSANIVLLQDSQEDLYGHWIGCLVKLSALVDPQKSLARLERRPPMAPFGFQTESDFYDHIRHAGGGMHIFTYEMRHDLGELFRDLLETAFALEERQP